MTKKLIPTAILIVALAFTSCGTTNDTRDYNWSVFCRTHGYHESDYSVKTVNEYLDTWRGSAAEEEALAKESWKI